MNIRPSYNSKNTGMYDKGVKHPGMTTTSKILMTELADKTATKKTLDETKFLILRWFQRQKLINVYSFSFIILFFCFEKGSNWKCFQYLSPYQTFWWANPSKWKISAKFHRRSCWRWRKWWFWVVSWRGGSSNPCVPKKLTSRKTKKNWCKTKEILKRWKM